MITPEGLSVDASPIRFGPGSSELVRAQAIVMAAGQVGCGSSRLRLQGTDEDQADRSPVSKPSVNGIAFRL